jgi:hypothetical protein
MLQSVLNRPPSGISRRLRSPLAPTAVDKFGYTKKRLLGVKPGEQGFPWLTVETQIATEFRLIFIEWHI